MATINRNGNHIEVWVSPHETHMLGGHLAGVFYQEVGVENLFVLDPHHLERAEIELDTVNIPYTKDLPTDNEEAP